MKDKRITCIQCEKSFVLSADEQEKMMARGFGLPKRCPDCRRNKQRWIEEPDERHNPGRGKKKRRREWEDGRVD